MSLSRQLAFVLLILTTAFLLGVGTALPVLAAENVTIVTRDGVQLTLTYFPGTEVPGSAQAKQTTPVLLLHDYKETRAIFNPLAERLQSGEAAGRQGGKVGASFAVITVDLRGHGESATQTLRDGSQVTIDVARLSKPMLQAMALYDMEAVRSFIVEKNDAGELNINKLCLVGTGMGASVAANWALEDWRTPPLAIGKQGQDVKALVLISPRWSFNGLSFQAPLRFEPLRENAAWLLMYGSQDAKSVKADVERIRKQLERSHPKATDSAGQANSRLKVINFPSKLQGGTLVSRLGSQVDPKIVEFLSQHVAKKQYPWSSRLARLPQ
jgi:pimeloyl-ACP methyl ester carboxylesterase